VYVADSGNNIVMMIDIISLNVSTIAGNSDNGPCAYGSDCYNESALAIYAGLNEPQGVCVDTSSNIYITDTGNNVVRMVSNGIITTIAGTGFGAGLGVGGNRGIGGPATSAQLNFPTGIAVDTSGNVYFSDTYNNMIKVLSPGGQNYYYGYSGGYTISVAAGTGVAGYNGDSFAGTSSMLYAPTGLFMDTSDNLYFADTGNRIVRKLNPRGFVFLQAGTPTQQGYLDSVPATSALLGLPTAVSIDPLSGDLIIADTDNNVIRRAFNIRGPGFGTVGTIAGNGSSVTSSPCELGNDEPATKASLYNPAGVAVDLFGNLYIADTNNYAIRLVALMRKFLSQSFDISPTYRIQISAR
jgi:NHL repeat